MTVCVVKIGGWGGRKTFTASSKINRPNLFTVQGLGRIMPFDYTALQPMTKQANKPQRF